jgi:hypothetical protein
MIEVHYKGQLGNRLFQYCFSRIVAEELGFSLAAEDITGFLGTLEPVRGETFDAPLIQIVDEEIVDLPRLLADHSPRKIWIRAYLQRAEYYTPFRHRIRRWLWSPPSAERPGADDLVLTIRLADFVWMGRVLAPDYYFDVCKRHGRGRVWIVTDQPGNPYLAQFDVLEPMYFNAEPLEQFNFLRSANHLVLSASTFHWWAAYLSDAATIYFPVLEQPSQAPGEPYDGKYHVRHWWTSADSVAIDLRVPAPNYIYIPDVPYGKAFTPGQRVDPSVWSGDPCQVRERRGR